MNRNAAKLIVVLSAISMIAGAGCTEGKAPRQVPTGAMPDTFRVAFETTKGRFVVEAYREWSPLGVKRFYELVNMGALDDNVFYRVIPNFVAQFGTPGDAKLTARLDSVTIPDESRKAKNLRGTIAYAQEGTHSRSHTLFVNRRDASHLDSAGFVPIGRVVEGMAVVDSVKWPYRERPDHALLATLGNRYMQINYPKADYVKSATVIPR